MRSLIAFAVLTSAATLSGTGQDKDPAKYESTGGKYTIAFPGKPTEINKKEKDFELNMAALQKGTVVYLVSYSDLKPEQVKEAKATEILENGQGGLVANFKVKVTSAKDTEFGPNKYPARQLLAEKESENPITKGKDITILRATLVLADNRLYQVFIVGPKEFATGKDIDKFFESFEIKK